MVRRAQEPLELDELAVSFLPDDPDEPDDEELESLLDSLFDDEDSDDFDSEEESLLAPFGPAFAPDFEDRLSVL